jgi:NAD(P)-dependent dehydrogenase (short-subunit alcohol dehydrogenase family)
MALSIDLSGTVGPGHGRDRRHRRRHRAQARRGGVRCRGVRASGAPDSRRASGSCRSSRDSGAGVLRRGGRERTGRRRVGSSGSSVRVGPARRRGIQRGRNVFEGVNGCDEEQWRACMELDLASHWRLGKAAHPHLRRGTGAVFIINSSNHAYSTLPGCFPYNVAKAGLVAMAQSMALEWGPRCPGGGHRAGVHRHAGRRRVVRDVRRPRGKRREVERRTPSDASARPTRSAACARSSRASTHAFVSGTTILIDGGHAANMGW